MKFLTKQSFRKFLEAPLEVWKALRPPQPFPGKYPTRVYFHAKGFEYFGKPSVTACRAFNSALQKCKHPFLTVEFDKHGPIYMESQEGKDHPRSQVINAKCWRAYHPQSYADSILSWMLYGIRTVEGRYTLGDLDDGIR